MFVVITTNLVCGFIYNLFQFKINCIKKGSNSAGALASNIRQTVLTVVNGDAACTAFGLTYDINTNYCAMDSTSKSNACFGN